MGESTNPLPAIDLSAVRDAVPRRLFQGVLDRIGRLSPAPSRGRVQPRFCQEGERSRESACLQCGFTTLAGETKTTRSMVHAKNRISHWIESLFQFSRFAAGRPHESRPRHSGGSRNPEESGIKGGSPIEVSY